MSEQEKLKVMFYESKISTLRNIIKFLEKELSYVTKDFKEYMRSLK